MVDYSEEIASYAKALWENLERKRIVKTRRMLREYGFQIRIDRSTTTRVIAGKSLLLPHNKIAILYRPFPERRPAESIIAETRREFEAEFDELLASKMKQMTLRAVEQGMKKLTKNLFLTAWEFD